MMSWPSTPMLNMPAAERDRDGEAGEDQRGRGDERLGERPDGGRDVRGVAGLRAPATMRAGSPNAPDSIAP